MTLKTCISGNEQYSPLEDLGSHMRIPLFVTITFVIPNTSRCDDCNSLHPIGFENRGSSATLEKETPQGNRGLCASSRTHASCSQILISTNIPTVHPSMA